MDGITGWGEFALAFALFFASHAVPALPALKARLAGVLGRRGYVALFSGVSTLILVWLIVAAGRAPFLPLWDQTPWHRLAANLVMPVAVLLAVFGVGAVNPFSFAGRAGEFDPERPGVAGLTRHPLLWALLLWSLAHLLVNGDLAHVILFGVFAGFAALGMAILDRRNRRLWGEEAWARLSARTALFPLAALLAGRWRPRGWPSPLRLGLALLIWAAVLHLHAPVIGVSPMP